MSEAIEREVLGKLRGRLAHSKQCAPYYIFGNDEFELLLKEKPKTLQHLASLKGFPAEGARVKKWGQAIVDLFAKPSSIKDFEVIADSSGEPSVKTMFKDSTFFG